MDVTLIAAVAEDGCIGRNGDLPWRLKDDLKRFRRLTLGKPVVMGRRTWDSLPRKPLDGRRNIVVSRSIKELEGAICAESIEAALRIATGEGADAVMVIGGGEIYALAMTWATCLQLTHVDRRVDDGDAFFPTVDPNLWKVVHQERAPHDPMSGEPTAIYRTYRRR